jgi:glycerate-2-kinase
MTLSLESDARSILAAALAAVDGAACVRNAVSIIDDGLHVDDYQIDLTNVRRLLVVGAGKATAAMMSGLLQSDVGDYFRGRIDGWINVPMPPEQTDSIDVYQSELDRCDAPSIRTWVARPAALNEPTERAVFGTREIRRLLSSANSQDLVIGLISGGGSALLVEPIEGVSLAEKLALTQMMAGNGADITQLNRVRRAVSRCKAGGLLAGCRAGHWLTLLISDVLGDPLDVIASGPTVPAVAGSPEVAIATLNEFVPDGPLKASLVEAISRNETAKRTHAPNHLDSPTPEHFVLANNAMAVDAGGIRAVDLGYNYWLQSGSPRSETVDAAAMRLANAIESMLDGNAPFNCLIDGGEPTVTLPEGVRGHGGRNQHLVLRVYQELRRRQLLEHIDSMVFLSAGTDGEDGNTTAAGALLSSDVVARIDTQRLDSFNYADAFESHRFFERVGGLVELASTQTNVCDLRIAIVRR